MQVAAEGMGRTEEGEACGGVVTGVSAPCGWVAPTHTEQQGWGSDDGKRQHTTRRCAVACP